MDALTQSLQACNEEDYRLFQSGDRSIHCLTRGQSIGLTIATEAGFISLIAVLFVFGIIARNVRLRVRRQRKWRIFVDPIDIIMFSLFLGDAIQALGAVVNIKWINEGKVEVGGFCTAQGVIQQLGETTVAMSTLLIAIYTFRGLWLGKSGESLRGTKIIISGSWFFVVIMIILGNTLNMHKDRQHRYETPTPYWCWIGSGSGYLQWAIWGEYVWFWITLGVSLCTYIPLFFWSRGIISHNKQSWWRFKVQRGGGGGHPQELRALSNVMLAYPIVYCFAILPLSVIRWMTFVTEANGSKSTIPSAATFAAVTLHLLSGSVNVVLLLTTRPNTPLFGKNAGLEEDTPLPNIGGGRGHMELPAERGGASESDDELGRLPSR